MGNSGHDLRSRVMQERWILIPQAPTVRAALSGPGNFQQGTETNASLVGRALLIRLAAKEEILEDIAGIGTGEEDPAECSMERAAACARLGVGTPSNAISGKVQLCLSHIQFRG